MKLRIRGDTLRLRLTRGEVDLIGEGQTVSEVTRFPDGSSLVYALAVAGDDITVAQESGAGGTGITVTIPAAAARDWAVSQAVGFMGDAPVHVPPLTVLIEKDFACLAPRAGEEESDTFPNPNAKAR